MPDRLASGAGTIDGVLYVRAARNVIGLAALGFVISAIAPVGAGACDSKKADAFRAAADRYHTARKYQQAAHWYLSATRLTRDCRTVSGTLLSARSLAQAGASLAQSGDYQSALDLLHAAQSKLTSLAAADSQTAAAARSYSELVQNVISAIDKVARASM